ncbi:MAG TPA: hypothetical protein VF487_19060 [Chitinophagaceae bacterium]
MKKMIIILAIAANSMSYSQQNFSLTSAINKKTTSETTIKTALGKDSILTRSHESIVGFYGIGNLNEEALNGINSSGKLSLFVKPYTYKGSKVIVNLSFNKNATNNDTLLAGTLIFPEIGDHSFLGSVDYIHKINTPAADDSTNHFWGLFGEFSNKKIKKSIEGKVGDKIFSTLNYTLGIKYLWGFKRTDFDCVLSASAYLSWFNIPDEDTADYRSIALKNFTPVNNNLLTDNFFSGGFKIAFQVNSFQIFADFRHIFRKDEVAVRELRGFHSNIGVVFNAKVFEL